MTARARPFRQLDVFTDRAGYGNPLAVVLDGSGLDDAAMQRFAAWTNLSETTFLLPPTQNSADYRVRIFTPGGELPFAGHPTLGSCHAWLAAGGVPRQPHGIVQECAAGLVHVRRSDQGLVFAAPPLRRSVPAAGLLSRVAGALGLRPAQVLAAQLLDNGPVWLALQIDSRLAVQRLAPDHAALRALNHKVGVVHVDPAAGADAAQPALTVRAFAAPSGIPEDPVTGSLNASLAQWLIAESRAPERYVASQGEALGRAGRVQVERDAGGQVWIGGGCVDCIEGTVRL
ncbi:PhzF family phenazine biosynthesis protein [Xylophilus sp.]|uniref:PhzF family phenazine biosynthesis protein n=1 Tax=Xylophilus sp. TaxID=2653893 RepID=UPI0013BADFDE|nr:PhzF family phenazine biosynthesis protein [Xylophilus sp.]KAF1044629.1 MAG: Trans-2,3-dihydro-3-hydroxyanthranilate isomerase [Xylophilus sp.]